MSVAHIPDIIAHQFPENWWNKYGYNNENFSEEGIDQLTLDIVSVRDKIFDELNKSILSGEYIVLDDLVRQLKDLKKILHELSVPQPESLDAQELIINGLNLNFTDALKIAITSYVDFIQWLKIKIRGGESDMVLINDELDDLFEEKEYEKDTQRAILFFFANLSIARYDHSLKPNIDDFGKLISFSRELLRSSRYMGNKFAIILQAKSKFLICKWLVRKSLTKGLLYAVVNSVEKEFAITDYKERTFQTWIDYLENHYETVGGWKAHISQGIASFRNKKLEDLTFLQLHELTKFYKDVQPNLNRLAAIKKEVQARYHSVKGAGDEYAIFVHSIAYNYLAGNEFSLLLDEANVAEHRVAEAYQKIVDIQTETGVSNFFPQFKYVEFIIKKLRAYPSALNMLKDLETQRSYIIACKKVFDTYESHIEWSRKNYNYVFHLPITESKVEIDNDEIKELYIASSFVLPLYKQEYIDAFEKFKKEIDAIDAAIITSENIQNELNKLTTAQQEIGQLKIELENREIKSIETLSIFTTIVTFVFASVVEFKFITTAFQAFLFTISLSAALSMFVFLIVLLRSNSFIVTVRHYFWRVLMAFMAITLLWFLIIYAPHLKLLIERQVPSKTNSRLPQNPTPSKENKSPAPASKS